jgi:flavin reductase (DIM6/NTAB) family NADH-FMN oxidoreductase RutF
MSFLSVDPKSLKVAQVHGYLLCAVAPRPIALVSTVDADGNPNLSPFSFFNVFSANPPIAIFSPARRGRDNTTKHTFENAKVHKECVINIVNYDMVQQMSLASCEYPKGVSEFEKAGFTPVASDLVRPYRVAESPVQLECKVLEVIATGTEGGAGNLVVCEVVCMHINDEVLDADGKIDPHKIDLVARMGQDYYCRASGSAVFEVPKPNLQLGVGIDALPIGIRHSSVLTGNDLGMLGNTTTIPNYNGAPEPAVIAIGKQYANDPNAKTVSLHLLARTYLANNNIDAAWQALLAADQV